MTDAPRTEPRLTIVLPLKGRSLFTLRFLWHANKVRLPYRFLIADGQVDPVLAELLEMPHVLFPNIDTEYIRYPDDHDFSHYFSKMFDALGRVTTPYAMLADNDDFLAFRGIERSIDFLETKQDYVCCGGGISGFSVYSPPKRPFGGLVGPLNKITSRYMPHDRSSDFGCPLVTDRLLLGLRNSWSYYAVFRSSALTTVWREIVDMNLSDLQLVEKFCAMRTLTLGKAKSDPSTIAYFRQYWTSLRSAFTDDWVHHLLRNRFSTDFANIIDRISSLAAEADGFDQKAVAESLRERIEPWLREFLRLNYGLSADVRRHLRRLAPSLVVWLKTRRRPSVQFERRALFYKLHKNGAAEEYLSALRLELAQIEDVVAGREFRDFLAPYASQLMRESSAKEPTAAGLIGSFGRV
jgi:glycosyltransferase domain-containing protein